MTGVGPVPADLVAEGVRVPRGWTRARSLFPSRYLSEYSIDRQSVFQLVLPGWSLSSQWTSAGFATDQARLEPETASRPSAGPVIVPARSDGPGTLGDLIGALVEHLDLAPEVVAAGMGVASAQPVLRPSGQIRSALDEHRRDDEYGRGENAALEWMSGLSDHRPVCRRPWPGGEPTPWQVDAERLIALSSADHGMSVDRLRGLIDRFLWATPGAGPAQPLRGDAFRWVLRRVGRAPAPAPAHAPTCAVRRGAAFRHWKVTNRDGTLGTVQPRSPRRWEAVVGGEPLTGRTHASVPDAGYEILLDAFASGRARPDPVGWILRGPTDGDDDGPPSLRRPWGEPRRDHS